MPRIFIGLDPRQPIAYHVLAHSILRRCSQPVSITPLMLHSLPIQRTGLTEFTFTRFLVPWLCGYEGKGIFMDSDMLVLGDVSELDPGLDAVRVVHFDDHLQFERPSVMVFNNEKCKRLTPEYIETGDPFSFEWADTVGGLDRNWNFLVGYEAVREGVKLVHYTQGIPAYKECRKCDFAAEWFNEQDAMNHHVSWLEIMGNSVHAEPVLERLSV